MKQRNKHLKWRLRKQKNYVKNHLKLLVKQSLGKGKRAQAQNQKKRRSSNNIIGFLRDKNTQENEFCQQELDFKR